MCLKKYNKTTCFVSSQLKVTGSFGRASFLDSAEVPLACGVLSSTGDNSVNSGLGRKSSSSWSWAASISSESTTVN